MKTIVENINVVLNNNYEEVKRFISFKMALEEYEENKKLFFDEKTAQEKISQNGEREIEDDENNLKLEYVLRTIPDDYLKHIHPASIADVEP